MPLFQTAASSVGVLGRTFGFIFKLKIMLIFIMFLLLSSVVIFVQDGPDAGIESLGKRLLTPTLWIQEFSLQVVEDGGIWVSSKSFVVNSWNVIFDMLGIFTQIYIMFFWISALGLWVRLYNNSQVAFSWFVGVVEFVLISAIYILMFHPDISPWITLVAFQDFVRAIPYIIQPITEVADRFVSK